MYMGMLDGYVWVCMSMLDEYIGWICMGMYEYVG